MDLSWIFDTFSIDVCFVWGSREYFWEPISIDCCFGLGESDTGIGFGYCWRSSKTVVIREVIVPGANLNDPIPKHVTNK